MVYGTYIDPCPNLFHPSIQSHFKSFHPGDWSCQHYAHTHTELPNSLISCSQHLSVCVLVRSLYPLSVIASISIKAQAHTLALGLTKGKRISQLSHLRHTHKRTHILIQGYRQTDTDTDTVVQSTDPQRSDRSKFSTARRVVFRTP